MAIFTHVKLQEMTQLLEQYRLGKLNSFCGIREGIQNTNYMIDTQKGKFIVTLYESYNSPDDLPFFNSLLIHMREKNIPCPTPIANKIGKFEITFKQKPGTIVTFLEGLQANKTNIEPDICYEAGKTLAKMHLAVKDFQPQRHNSMAVRNLPNWLCKWKISFKDEKLPETAAEIENSLDYIISHWPDMNSDKQTDLPYAIIHADYFPDNIFLKGGSVSGVIDFNFACTDFLIYDLAIAVNAFCFEDHGTKFEQKLCAAIIKGYQQNRKITDAEKKIFNLMCQGAAMRFLLSRLADQKTTPDDAVINIKNPDEYLNILRFHRSNPTYERQ